MGVACSEQERRALAAAAKVVWSGARVVPLTASLAHAPAPLVCGALFAGEPVQSSSWLAAAERGLSTEAQDGAACSAQKQPQGSQEGMGLPSEGGKRGQQRLRYYLAVHMLLWGLMRRAHLGLPWCCSRAAPAAGQSGHAHPLEQGLRPASAAPSLYTRGHSSWHA